MGYPGGWFSGETSPKCTRAFWAAFFHVLYVDITLFHVCLGLKIAVLNAGETSGNAGGLEL